MIGTRAEWARTTLPVWEEIADPVAIAIPRAISQMMASQAPEDMQGLISGMSGPMEQVSKSLFTMQLAGVVGKLSGEVLSGGDIGIPLVSGSNEYDVKAFLLAQNMRAFSHDLDVPQEEADIYLATREIAHARLYRQAKWLRLHIMSAIHDFAGGISIDLSRVMELADDFDPMNAEAMKELLTTGALLPERTEEQNRALERLEGMLALIEGWVDHVTGLATARLPKSGALGEAIRRRRASGVPRSTLLQPSSDWSFDPESSEKPALCGQRCIRSWVHPREMNSGGTRTLSPRSKTSITPQASYSGSPNLPRMTTLTKHCATYWTRSHPRPRCG